MKKFQFVKKFTLQVPNNYQHDTFLDSQGEIQETSEDVDVWNSWEVTDENFKKVSNRLVAGEVIEVTIFKIIGHEHAEKCIDFLIKENSLLLGAHGAALVLILKKDELPEKSKCFSLDKRECLYQEIRHNRPMDHFIPFIKREDSRFVFEVEEFDDRTVLGGKTWNEKEEYLFHFRKI